MGTSSNGENGHSNGNQMGQSEDFPASMTCYGSCVRSPGHSYVMMPRLNGFGIPEKRQVCREDSQKAWDLE